MSLSADLTGGPRFVASASNPVILSRFFMDIPRCGMRWYPFGRISAVPRVSSLTSFSATRRERDIFRDGGTHQGTASACAQHSCRSTCSRSGFVVLETMPAHAGWQGGPCTALPAPAEADNEFEDYVAPRNKTEEILAGIWQELLKLSKVSVKDSFFDLGGQSLLAVRLFNRIEQEFGRRFPLAMLFRAPTIEQLARKLTADDDTASEWPSLVPIQPNGSKTPLFLVHGAGGNVLLYRALAKRLEPDYPLYGLQSQGLDGQSKPLQTIEEMADRYLQEIRTVQPTGPYLLGGYCLGGTVAYEMAQRLVAGGEKVAMVAMLDTYNFNRALKVSFFSFLMQKVQISLGQLCPAPAGHHVALPPGKEADCGRWRMGAHTHRDAGYHPSGWRGPGGIGD